MTGGLYNEAKRLRGRGEALADHLTRRDQDVALGSASLVARTVVRSSYPASARRFFACVPQTVLGREVEGGAGVLTDDPATFLALNLGTAVPPVGTTVLATFVESRWVFRSDG